MILKIILGILAGFLILHGMLGICQLFADAIDEAITDWKNKKNNSKSNNIYKIKTMGNFIGKKVIKRLPTIEEWRWLIDNYKWKWDDEHKGQVVTAKNGNSIFLPAAGYQRETSLGCVGSLGGYWSSSLEAGHPDGTYHVFFNSDYVGWNVTYRFCEHSVRPVSDTPQEGFVDMGNNLFWAIENEDGYYTYDEAMALFTAELPKSEDYGIDGLYAAIDILQTTLGEVDGYQTDDGILEHKCAISAVKELYEQQHTEWSEEDETCLTNILIMLKEYVIHHYSKDDVNKSVNWLENRFKSLHPQPHWKPSEK